MIETREINRSTTVEKSTGCGKLRLVYTDVKDAPSDVKLYLGKNGGCANCIMQSTAELISLCLSKGATLEEVSSSIKGMACHKVAGVGVDMTASCIDAVAKSLSEITAGDLLAE